jgi:hypothetical protein
MPSTPSHHEHLPVISKSRSSSDPANAVTRTTLTCSSSSTHHSATTDCWLPSPHRFPSMLCTTEPPHGQPPPAAVQCRLLILELCSNSVVLTDYCRDQPSALAGIDRRLLLGSTVGSCRRLLLGSTVGSCWDRLSAFAGIDRRLNHL